MLKPLTAPVLVDTDHDLTVLERYARAGQGLPEIACIALIEALRHERAEALAVEAAYEAREGVEAAFAAENPTCAACGSDCLECNGEADKLAAQVDELERQCDELRAGLPHSEYL